MTEYSTRPELTKNFITWDESIETWNSVIYTWDDDYSYVS
jgi:hypothetical protein